MYHIMHLKLQYDTSTPAQSLVLLQNKGTRTRHPRSTLAPDPGWLAAPSAIHRWISALPLHHQRGYLSIQMRHNEDADNMRKRQKEMDQHYSPLEIASTNVSLGPLACVLDLWAIPKLGGISWGKKTTQE